MEDTEKKPALDKMSDDMVEEYEGDLMSALLRASSYKQDESEHRRIKIQRNGVVLLTFIIRPLDDEEFKKCRDKNLKEKSGKFGVRTEKLDRKRFLNQAIYMATVPDEKTGVKLWDYQKETLWQKLNVASGVDAVGVILKPGEKESVYDAIEQISGYTDDEKITEDIKN